MSLAKTLHDEISKVCLNISGVSIGVETDKKTWVIWFTDQATPAEKAAVQDIINRWPT